MQYSNNRSPFGELLLKFRQLGVGFISVSQMPSMIDTTVLSCSNIIISFCLSSGNDKYVIKRALSLDNKGEQILGMLQPGEFIARQLGCNFPHPFTGKTELYKG